MKRAIWITVLLLSILLPNPAGAQVQSTDLPSVGESSIVLVNRGNIDIVFSIRPLDGEWAEYTVASGSNMKISCDNCSTNAFEIYISTDGNKAANYNLDANGRFSIEWNDTAQMWDVYHIE